MTDHKLPEYTAHFVRLAIVGKNRGCSGGEKAARDLARAMIKFAGRLDDSALLGAQHFISIAAASPNLAADLARVHTPRAR